MAYWLLLGGGIAESGRYYVAFVYLVEWSPNLNENSAGLWIFEWFGIVMTLIGLQFWLLEPSWTINVMWAYLFGLISLIGVYWKVPESPRYLYSKAMYKETAEVFAYISL